MINSSPLSHIDPDENYFSSDGPSIDGSVKYYSSGEYNDMIQNFNSDYVSVITYNIRSFSANEETLFTLLDSLVSYPQIIVLTETWFSEDNKFEINGYNGYHTVRSDRRSGGVSVYVSKSLESQILSEITFIYNYIEICSVKIKLGSEYWYLLGIYRPHSGTPDEFLQCLSEILDIPEIHNKKVLITGDLNVDLLKECSSSEDLITFFQSYHFLPKISQATRFPTQNNINPTLLDHIWTNSLLDHPSGIFSYDILDHCPTFFIIFCKSCKTKDDPIKLTFRPYSDENLTKFIHSLVSFNWSELDSSDVHASMHGFITKLNFFYCKCFPIKIKFISSKAYQNPWITSEILNLIKYKNLFFKLFIQGAISKEENNLLKNKINRVIKKAKLDYYKNSFARSMKDIKKTWKLLKNLIGTTPTSCNISKIVKNGLEITNEKDIANEFNSFFNSIGNSLSTDLPPSDGNPLSYVVRNVHSIFLAPVTAEEINKIILGLNNKKSDLDSCSIPILKQISIYISPILSKIINLSFQNGVFPNCLKHACITPIFKNGNKNEINNYRPISILSPYSKIFEKCVLDRLWSFIRRFNLITPQQFGFLKGSSTEKAVLNLTEYFYRNLNLGFHSIAVYVDFKKAFDSIDHNILLQKLESYGIRGVALQWFRSFLKDRSHAVKIQNSLSHSKILNVGIPQGSQIAPVLFLLYINDLPKFSKVASTILFADDTTICFSSPDLSELTSLCNSELEKFYSWTKSNKLTLNVAKTNCMLVSNRANDANCPTILLNNSPLQFKSSVKFLGIVIDNKLNFSEHIKTIKNKLSKNVGILNRLKKFVPPETLRNLYFSLLYPYLNYCVIIWGGTFATHIHPIKILQKRAIRIINRVPALTHSNPLFLQSKILKLEDNYKFRVCEYFYVNELADNFSRTHAHDTRFYNSLVPDFQRLSSTQKSINFAGPTFWNNIPNDIKNSNSRKIFKTKLSSHILTSYIEE